MKNYELNNTELHNRMNEIEKTVNENGTTTFTIPHYTVRGQIIAECVNRGLKATTLKNAHAYVIISKR